MEQEILMAMQAISAYFKTAVGAANNAAWLVCLEAHDHIKKHPAYKHRVKQAYKRAIDAFHAYERTLIYAETNRLFRVSDIPAEQRQQYGDITDRDYYDMWTSCGVAAYENTHDLMTSLWNKYRVSLVNHKVRHADLLAWPMMALCALSLACKFFDSAVEGAKREWQLPEHLMRKVFGQLSLENVRKAWSIALMETDPSTVYDLDEVEDRNIMLGIQQLEEEWASPDIIIGSTYAAIKDWRENFASKAHHKAAMKRILQIKNAYKEEL